MAQISLKINGYAYTVGCEDGQEDHLRAMASEIEVRMTRIKALGGQSGESRLLVLAALLMADELHDMAAELNDAQRTPSKSAKAVMPAASGHAARHRPGPVGGAGGSCGKHCGRDGAGLDIIAGLPGASGTSPPGPISTLPGAGAAVTVVTGTRRPPAQAGLGRVRRQRPGRLHFLRPLPPREGRGEGERRRCSLPVWYLL